MKPSSRTTILILFSVCALAFPALAYQYPLSSTEIRHAYFTGRQNDQSAAAVFSRYVRQMPQPKKGPYVERLGIDTPYTQIAERSDDANYSAQDAEREYLNKPMIFRAYVQIFLTSSYQLVAMNSPNATFLAYPDFWQDFKIKFVQDGREVPAISQGGGFLYPPLGSDDGPVSPIGARVVLEYDPAKIDAAPITLQVETPDGQTVETTFNLSELH